MAKEFAGWKDGAHPPKNILSKAELLFVIEKEVLREDTSTFILVMRSADRFFLTTPEPYAWLRGRQIIGATSVLYDGLISKGSNVAFGVREDLAVAFAGADVDVSVQGENSVVTCRSRVTACHLAMGLVESTAGRGVGSGSCDSW